MVEEGVGLEDAVGERVKGPVNHASTARRPFEFWEFCVAGLSNHPAQLRKFHIAIVDYCNVKFKNGALRHFFSIQEMQFHIQKYDL